jgi:hypothetical protein
MFNHTNDLQPRGECRSNLHQWTPVNRPVSVKAAATYPVDAIQGGQE